MPVVEALKAWKPIAMFAATVAVVVALFPPAFKPSIVS